MAQQVQRVAQVVCGIPDASEGRCFTTGKCGPQPRARLGKLAQVSAVQLASQLARHLSIRSVARLEQPSIHDLEAMKMEHTIRAPEDGVLKEFFYTTGDQVNEGVVLLRLD